MNSINPIVRWWVTPKLPPEDILAKHNPISQWITHPIKRRLAKKYLQSLRQSDTGIKVIGITGTVTKGAIFVEEITQPDLPIKREERTTTDEVYAAFLSDIHIGSKKFLGSKFEALLDFLSGKSNSDISWDAQSDILDKLKYIFVAGDVINLKIEKTAQNAEKQAKAWHIK